VRDGWGVVWGRCGGRGVVLGIRSRACKGGLITVLVAEQEGHVSGRRVGPHQGGDCCADGWMDGWMLQKSKI
jgi:hypothetical protein